MIYIKKGIACFERKDLKIFKEGIFESCFIELTKSKLIIGEIYRIPNTCEADFLSDYQIIMNKIKSENKKLIIGTDQNLDLIKYDIHPNTSKFLDINLSSGLLPSILRPTRITKTTATLIDNVYVDMRIDGYVKSAILLTRISDHLPCFVSIGNGGP